MRGTHRRNVALPLIEELEPRVLFSAGLDVVLIDSHLQDAELLRDASTSAEAVVLYDSTQDSAADLLTRASEIAQARGEQIQSLSILSHGAQGQFQLGTDTISLDSLNLSADAWRTLASSMVEGGNIYLFGCNVGAQGQGDALVDKLAELTGSDVFVSDDLTGEGGDWTLEVASEGDQAEADAGLDTPFSMNALSQYHGTLSNTAPVVNDQSFSVAENSANATAVGTVVASDPDATAGAWYNASWTHRKELTVDHTKVAATQTNFAMLVSLSSDSQLAAGAQADGDDILFTDVNGTKLDHEIERFTSATGELMAWVRIPSLSSSSDTKIYMYYGNSGASNQENATGVWDSNYSSVYHLGDGDSTAAGFYQDSTSKNHDATLVDSDGSVTQTTGEIGKALDLSDADDDYLTVGSSTDFTMSSGTIDVWLKTGSHSGTVSLVELYKDLSNRSSLYFDGGNGGKLTFHVTRSGSMVVQAVANTTLADNAWHHVSVTWNSSGATIRVDYNSVTGSDSGDARHSWGGSTTARLAEYGGSTGYNYDGMMDEVRYSNVNRSDTWLQTEYNNQKNPGTFMSLGGQESKLTYSITAGNGSGAFAINASTGAITVANSGQLNYESAQSYGLTVQVSDGTLTDTATITVNVTDVNEYNPTVNNATWSLAENSANGTAVGTVSGADSDTLQTRTYAITAGNGSGAFAINSSTGAITVANVSQLNYESTTQYVLTVQATDSGSPAKTGSGTITINISDVNEYNPTVNNATWSLAENSANSTAVGTVSGADSDTAQTRTWAITAGNASGAFAINSTTGAITVANGSQLNYESVAQYVLTVQATDSGSPAKTGSGTVTINISDVNEYDPVVNNATLSLAENSANATVVGTVSGSDSDTSQTRTYAITAGNASGAFAINSTTGAITVANGSQLNYEGTSQYVLTVQATDSGSPARTGSGTITINLTDVNEFDPVVNNATLSLAENSANATVVGTVSGSDSDTSQTRTYAITAGNASGAFAINSTTGAITVANGTQLNYEGTTQYVLTVQATDSGSPSRTGSGTITINLTDVNEFDPVVNNATLSLAENSANATVVGTVSGSDSDTSQTRTYAITAGNASGAFAINSTTGVITVANGSLLNYEGTSQYVLTVQATDSGSPARTGNGTITINLTDVNEFDPVVNNATLGVAENSANGTTVGTVSSSDSDTSQTRTYAITAGNASGAFAINSTTGAITVANGSLLNYEGTTQYVLTVQATDSGSPARTGNGTITINLTDVNEAAPVAPDQVFSVAENAANATVVGTVSATDADSSQTLSYAITAGNASGAFAINASTGVITVANGTLLNYEGTPQYVLTVTVTDSGSPSQNDTASVTINLSDVNEFDPVVNNATLGVAENSANGTTVGTVSGSDSDTSQTRTYAITAGNASGAFAINASTGVITVANGTLLNYEGTSQYVLTVQATDSGSPARTGNGTITINLSDVNEAAPVAPDQVFGVAENAANATVVGTVTATDADTAQTRSYAITAGNGAGAFAINSSTGVITVANGTLLNYESTTQYVLTVTVTDSGTPSQQDTASVTINVSDVNEFAPVANDATFSLDENRPNGTVVGTVSSSDADTAQTRSYAITAGNGDGVFAINATTGQITVVDAGQLSWDLTPQYVLTVTVTDSGAPALDDTATITININDINAGAPVVDDDSFSVAENTVNGTSVGTVSATDPDVGQTLTYAITAGNGSGAFAINATTGEITIADDTQLDHESTTQYVLTVTVTDDAGVPQSGTGTITIDVTDVNEFAPVAPDRNFSVAENSPNGTAVGTVTATDADTSETRTYAITGGNGAGAFAINSTTGVITVANKNALNHEATAQYVLTVTVTDSGTPSQDDTSTVTIDVTDVNEFAPVAPDQAFSVAENAVNATLVGTVTATDADTSQTRTYAITAGNAAGAFAINATTGVISVADGTLLDHEGTSQYVLTVTVTDSGSPAQDDTATVTIDVTDANEFAPVAPDQSFSVSETAVNGTAVGTVTSTDADTSQTRTYAITGGNGSGAFAINASTGVITVADASALDHESTAQYVLTVTVTDSGAPSQDDTSTVTIDVTDVNEFAPVAPDQNFSVAENAANATVVGTVTSTDADTSQTRTYAITAGNGSGAFAINATTGVITVADGTLLDHEGTSQYVLTVTVTDSGTPSQQDAATVTIDVTDVNESAPVAVDASFSVAENAANGTVLGTVSASDADSSQTRTYAITGGNASGAFAINATTGEITVADGSVLDYESAAQYVLTVTVTDSGVPAQQDNATVTIDLTDVNEYAPVAPDQSFSVAEGAANATVVGTVTATDSDTAQTRSYAISGGNASGAFAINATTGVITVANGSLLDREGTAQYVLTVTVTDSGSPSQQDTASVTIDVTDVNEFAPVAPDQSFSVAENAANATVVGTVTSTDADSAQTRTYAITAGNASGAFAINATTGVITVADGTLLNHEGTAQYVLTVTVTDSGTPAQQDASTVTIDVTDVNEFAPVAVDATLSVVENAANGTSLGTVAASDSDTSQTRSYAITAGNASGAFAINATTGEITVANGSVLDAEGTAQYTLTVTVTDSGAPPQSDTATITVDVTDANEFAPVALDATFGVAEDATDGALVGVVSAFDADASQTLSYAITNGDPTGIFTIDPVTGQISVLDSAQLDYESAPSYTLTVTVTDSGVPPQTDTATITIQLTDANEFAPVAVDAAFTVAEDASSGTVVGSVTATDADTSETRTYAITAGNASGAFAINATTGVITVANSSQLDFESAPQYVLTVTVTDSGSPARTDTSTVTIDVTDVNEYAPTAVDANFDVAEDANNGFSVGFVGASDSDSAQTWSYAITAGDPGGVFAIDFLTGEIVLWDSAQLDHEAQAHYALTVTVTDSGAPSRSSTATVNISVTDVNEFAPVAVNGSFGVLDNASNGALVGTVSASDADTSELRTYAITAGNASGAFAINVNTGAITVANSSLLNHGAVAQYVLTVQVSDDGSPTQTGSATVTINVAAAPGVDPAVAEAAAAAEAGSASSVTTTEEAPVAVAAAEEAPQSSAAAVAATASARPRAERLLVVEQEVSPEGESVLPEAHGVAMQAQSSATLLDALNTVGSHEVLAKPAQVRVHAEWQPLDAQALFNEKSMAQQLDRQLSKVHEDLEGDATVTYGMSQLGSSAMMFTAGAVSWLMRTSTLATSLITSLPTWLRFDPLPILEGDDKKQQDDEEFENWRQDRDLDDLFEDDGSGPEDGAAQEARPPAADKR